jgi:ABC-type polar amino acid transport system ATPase subunit
VVELRGVSKWFGERRVLDAVSLRVAEGEKVAIVGPSGGGKSTLVRLVNGLEEPDVGELEVCGRTIRPDAPFPADLRAEVGMIFQSFHLFPHLDALGNVALAPRLARGLTRAAAEERAHELLARVGLAERARSRPHELSGGEKQRVAIARALAVRPRVLLCDEPTSALDPELAGEVLDVLQDLARGGLTMIVVTHAIAFARAFADRVVFLDAGRVAASGPAAEMLEAPAEPRLRDFLSRVRRA